MHLILRTDDTYTNVCDPIRTRTRHSSIRYALERGTALIILRLEINYEVSSE